TRGGRAFDDGLARDHGADPIADLWDQGEVDRVLDPRLTERDHQTALFEQVTGLATEADRDDRVVGAVGDVCGHAPLGARVELPAANHWIEAAHHQQARGLGPAHAQGHGARDGGALAETADHRLLPRDPAVAE